MPTLPTQVKDILDRQEVSKFIDSQDNESWYDNVNIPRIISEFNPFSVKEAEAAAPLVAAVPAIADVAIPALLGLIASQAGQSAMKSVQFPGGRQIESPAQVQPQRGVIQSPLQDINSFTGTVLNPGSLFEAFRQTQLPRQQVKPMNTQLPLEKAPLTSPVIRQQGKGEISKALKRERTYDSVQKEIDIAEYNGVAQEKIDKLYEERNKLGMQELKTAYGSIKSELDKVDSESSDKILKDVLKIDLTTDSSIYMASFYGQNLLDNPVKLKEELFNVVRRQYEKQNNVDLEGLLGKNSALTEEGKKNLKKTIVSKVEKLQDAIGKGVAQQGKGNRWTWGAEPAAAMANEPIEFLDAGENFEDAKAALFVNEEGKYYISRDDGTNIYNPKTKSALFETSAEAKKAAEEEFSNINK